MYLKELIKLKRGYDLPYSNRIKGKYPIYSSSRIIGYHNEYKIDAPSVITGRSGSLGIVQYSTQKCWPLNTTLYVSDFKNNNPRYVYYLLKSLKLEKYGTGSAVPTLNRNHLDMLNIKSYSLEEQQHIVDSIRNYSVYLLTSQLIHHLFLIILLIPQKLFLFALLSPL